MKKVIARKILIVDNYNQLVPVIINHFLWSSSCGCIIHHSTIAGQQTLAKNWSPLFNREM